MPTYLSCHLSPVFPLTQYITPDYNTSSFSLAHKHTHTSIAPVVSQSWITHPVEIFFYIWIWSMILTCDIILSFIILFFHKIIEILFTHYEIYHFILYNSMSFIVFIPEHHTILSDHHCFLFLDISSEKKSYIHHSSFSIFLALGNY